VNAIAAPYPFDIPEPEAMPPAALRLRSAMMTERSDEDLMLAYASGDARAFELLYTRHRGPLFRFLLRGLKRRELADELFQETWGRVIQARTRYRVEAKFSTWLLQIAHNLVIDQYRRERPEDNGETAENAFRVAENDERERPDRVLSDFEQSRRLQKRWRNCRPISAAPSCCGSKTGWASRKSARSWASDAKPRSHDCAMPLKNCAPA
jgi:RNA polymerase sigma-70 factor (ECF subfamily)